MSKSATALYKAQTKYYGAIQSSDTALQSTTGTTKYYGAIQKVSKYLKSPRRRRKKAKVLQRRTKVPHHPHHPHPPILRTKMLFYQKTRIKRKNMFRPKANNGKNRKVPQRYTQLRQSTTALCQAQTEYCRVLQSTTVL